MNQYMIQTLVHQNVILHTSQKTTFLSPKIRIPMTIHPVQEDFAPKHHGDNNFIRILCAPEKTALFPVYRTRRRMWHDVRVRQTVRCSRAACNYSTAAILPLHWQSSGSAGSHNLTPGQAKRSMALCNRRLGSN
jgi:hypothetical protein